MAIIRGFLGFIRERGVVGLAVGFIFGGAITKLVTAFVTDIVDPLIGLVFGVADRLQDEVLVLGTARIAWGDFLVALIDFLLIAVVLFFLVKGLGLEKVDRKKPS